MGKERSPPRSFCQSNGTQQYAWCVVRGSVLREDPGYEHSNEDRAVLVPHIDTCIVHAPLKPCMLPSSLLLMKSRATQTLTQSTLLPVALHTVAGTISENSRTQRTVIWADFPDTFYRENRTD